MAAQLDSHDAQWRAHYDRYALGGHEYQPIQVHVEGTTIFGKVSPKDEVVDVGYGYGRAVPILKRLGVRRYMGVDFSEEQIKLARKKYPNLRFEVCSLYDLGKKYPHAFGGFIFLAVLMCVPRSRAVEALISIRSSLKRGAIGMLSTRSGVGAVINNDGMPVHYYRVEDLLQVVHEAGFQVDAFLGGAMIQVIVKA